MRVVAFFMPFYRAEGKSDYRMEMNTMNEWDRLLERFGLLRGDAGTLAAVPPAAVRGRRDTPYGSELLVERALLPARLPAAPVGVEDLFILLAKEVDGSCVAYADC